MIDAFKGLNAPFELTTYEAMCKIKEKLNTNGMVITNILSSLEGNEAKFAKYEYATYKAIFDDVKIYAVKTDDKTQYQNLILIGIKGNPEADENKYLEYKNLLDTEVLDFSSNSKIVTDDFAPIGN